MRVIIFGIGNYFKEQEEKLRELSEIEIVAFSDNNSDLWYRSIGNITIIPPDAIEQQIYDCILIMSIYVCDIYKQLIDLGIHKDRIIEWKRFLHGQDRGRYKLLYPKRKVLIITQELNYDGGSLAAIYAAYALKEHDIISVIAVPGGNSKLIDEVLQQGVPVILCPALPYIFEEEKIWMLQYDAVIVNLLTMAESVCEINRFRPVFWWLHEVSSVYEPVMKRSPLFADMEQFENMNIYAVSSMAKDIFHRYLTCSVKDLLPLGIPDQGLGCGSDVSGENRLVFAIIGAICARKAQDIFVDAAIKVCKKREAEFWIIGRSSKDDYCQNIINKIIDIDNIRLMGEMTRTELKKAFEQIDVVVCASQEETLSLVVIEAMMHGKASITTDNTGISEFIREGENGFVVPVNDAQALSDKMEWIILNKDEINRMGVAARKTYEENFNMSVFADSLEEAVEKTISEWNIQDKEHETAYALK